MCSACSRSTAWLLAQMKSAGWLPNHVIALEALFPPWASPTPDLTVRHHYKAAPTHASRVYQAIGISLCGDGVDHLPRHHGRGNPGCLVGERHCRDLALEQARHPGLASRILARHSHDSSGANGQEPAKISVSLLGCSAQPLLPPELGAKTRENLMVQCGRPREITYSGDREDRAGFGSPPHRVPVQTGWNGQWSLQSTLSFMPTRFISVIRMSNAPADGQHVRRLAKLVQERLWCEAYSIAGFIMPQAPVNTSQRMLDWTMIWTLVRSMTNVVPSNAEKMQKRPNLILRQPPLSVSRRYSSSALRNRCWRKKHDDKWIEKGSSLRNRRTDFHGSVIPKTRRAFSPANPSRTDGHDSRLTILGNERIADSLLVNVRSAADRLSFSSDSNFGVKQGIP